MKIELLNDQSIHDVKYYRFSEHYKMHIFVINTADGEKEIKADEIAKYC